MLYSLLRPLLFQLPPERAHALTLAAADFAARLKLPLAPRIALPCQAMGLNFSNPVGLAAGLDKDGQHINALAQLGFGFIEIGTVTPRPQVGNPQPRLFRLPEAGALINRMGFNNLGIDACVQALSRRRPGNYQLGVNIGKNKDTPAERAADDYLLCLQRVYTLADYVTVNISSPNTPGLRDLQHGAARAHLLQTLAQERTRLCDQHGHYLPMALKIAPDLENSELASLADDVNRFGFDALIATNTTNTRDAVTGLRYADETGGLSGRPLCTRAQQIAGNIKPHLDPRVALIGVGGIDSAQAACTRRSAGADLLQVYTGLIYRGPQLVGEILKALKLQNLDQARAL